jgi:nucleotidyltransferase substrate binding protein (TIGR01987 family)
MIYSTRVLHKAVASLEIALRLPKNDIVRDSAIQRFEYCFELSWKAVKKQLVLGLSRRELFRIAQNQKLIASQHSWFEFHLARNSTSHNYNETNAEQVYATTVLFLAEMKLQIQELEQRGWNHVEPEPS